MNRIRLLIRLLIVDGVDGSSGMGENAREASVESLTASPLTTSPELPLGNLG
jgi:hypothetical protein